VSEPAASDPGAYGAANSPWSANRSIDADVLPSANVLQPTSAAAAPPPSPPIAARPGSRAAMTIGLAVAAVALIALVIYFVMLERGSEVDPDDVNVGSEQRDYGDEPAPTASATGAPSAPKPVAKPPPAKPKPPPDDVYDGL
jgi:hypothetical protein